MNILDTSHIPGFPTQIMIGWSKILTDLSDAILSENEKEMMSRMVNTRRKAEFLTARHCFWNLVDELKWDRTNTELGKEELGKPFIEKDSERAFVSFSHTNELVFCAVSESLDIGLDTESVDREVNPAIVKRILSENEWEVYGEDDPIALWTMKEAAVKSLGTGLRTNLKEIELHKFEGGTFSINLAPERNLQGLCFEALNHCISIAF